MLGFDIHRTCSQLEKMDVKWRRTREDWHEHLKAICSQDKLEPISDLIKFVCDDEGIL
jgi:hypothetical protein